MSNDQFRLVFAALAILILPTAGVAKTTGALFDVAERRANLALPAFEPVRSACLTIEVDEAFDMRPIKGLKKTRGYGTDQSAEDFSWVLMTLAGRTLAGDDASEEHLAELLHKWASADAFAYTDKSSDGLFSLKRVLLPTIVAYSIVREGMRETERRVVSHWIDELTTSVDQLLDGDSDHNNHRYLADAVLTAWGAMRGSDHLLARGRDRLRNALLVQMRSDGSLPLEARRGSRAIWYHRQSLASLTVIVAALNLAGDPPLDDPALAQAWDRSLTFFLDTIEDPERVFHYAAENYRPGPGSDYTKQDLSFLDRRGHDRHYMAWTELASKFRPYSEPGRRLASLVAQEIAEERPLIDEFAGGAATCFWNSPAVAD